MRSPLAFVLGGGGSRGALQVGALRALLEANIQPDLFVGTSSGAINATYLAMRGFTQPGLAGLESAWREAALADLLPSNYLWLTVRTLFDREQAYPYQRIRNFLIAHGLTPEARFRDIPGPRLLLVAADLNRGRTVLYGEDPDQLVLEGLLASAALPPWMRPLEVDGRYMIDGGLVSNLPIEPALAQGAAEIVALDVDDPRSISAERRGFGVFVAKLTTTVAQREKELELALAAARHVPVWQMALQTDAAVSLWDFSQTDALIASGYERARHEIAKKQLDDGHWWRQWLPWLERRISIEHKDKIRE